MRLLKSTRDLQLLVCATELANYKNTRRIFKKSGMVVLFPKEFITPDINTQLHHVEVNRHLIVSF